MVTKNKRINVTIRNGEHLKKIESDAKKEGISKSDLINRIVALYYDSGDDEQISKEIRSHFQLCFVQDKKKYNYFLAKKDNITDNHLGYRPSEKIINKIFREQIAFRLESLYSTSLNYHDITNPYFVVLAGKAKVEKWDITTQRGLRKSSYSINIPYIILPLGQFQFTEKNNPIFQKFNAKKNTHGKIKKYLDPFSFFYMPDGEMKLGITKTGTGTIYNTNFNSKPNPMINITNGCYYVLFRNHPRTIKESLKRKGIKHIRFTCSEISPTILLLPVPEIEYLD